MCGGRGTRLEAAGVDAEKPLVAVAGVPMVDRVLDAVAASRAERVHAVVSPNAPATHDHLRSQADEGPAAATDPTVIEAPGDGYVADLGYALERVDRPVITVAADLPLLPPATVDRAVDAAGEGSLAVYVPVEMKRDLGVSVDTEATVDGRPVAPTGLNVVGLASADDGGRDPSEDALVIADDRLAVNVNRPRDLRVAAALLRRRRRDAAGRAPDDGANQ